MGPIFADFTIDHGSTVEADFRIRSNLQTEQLDFLYGSADVAAIAYQQVPIQTGQLVVRGTERYIEVDIIQAHGSEGDLHGVIGFAHLPDGIPSLLSLHLDLHCALSQQAIRQLLGPRLYAQVVGDVAFSAKPKVHVEGVSYTLRDYPQFAGKRYHHFSVDLPRATDLPRHTTGPPQIAGLYRCVDHTAAGGRLRLCRRAGSAAVDILDHGAGADLICVQMQLNDADEEQAIANLPALDSFEDDFRTDSATADGPGRLDAQLHAIGPIDAPFSATGYGEFSIRDKALGSIQMLGPLSRILQGTALGFTSFELDTLTAQFRLEDGYAHLPLLRVDGPRTGTNASGSVELETQALDMRVGVRLFGNATSEGIQSTGSPTFQPTMLMRFRVTGTLDVRICSTYDPRNLLPGQRQ